MSNSFPDCSCKGECTCYLQRQPQRATEDAQREIAELLEKEQVTEWDLHLRGEHACLKK